MQPRFAFLTLLVIVTLVFAGPYRVQAQPETPATPEVAAEPSRGDIVQAEMPGIDMSGANMEGKKIEFSKLQGGNFKGASFKNATIEHVDFHGADFSEANFTGATIKYVKFIGATMPNANFSEAKLEYVDFSEMDDDEMNSDQPGAKEPKTTTLTGARFAGANLQYCEFRGANAEGADFSGATLEQVQFSPFGFNESSLTTTEETPGAAGASARPGAVLRSAKFQNCKLSYAEFIATDCTGADFSGSTMEYTDFRKAVLVDVNMRVKSMEYVETQGANMSGMKR